LLLPYFDANNLHCFTLPNIQKLKPILNIGATLLNEFENNQEILYGALPHLFPLGRGLSNFKGPLPKPYRDHLQFYDNRFIDDKNFMALMFHQQQRHGNIRNRNLLLSAFSVRSSYLISSSGQTRRGKFKSATFQRKYRYC
jgi:hypothetical protein